MFCVVSVATRCARRWRAFGRQERAPSCRATDRATTTAAIITPRTKTRSVGTAVAAVAVAAAVARAKRTRTVSGGARQIAAASHRSRSLVCSRTSQQLDESRRCRLRFRLLWPTRGGVKRWRRLQSRLQLCERLSKRRSRRRSASARLLARARPLASLQSKIFRLRKPLRLSACLPAPDSERLSLPLASAHGLSPLLPSSKLLIRLLRTRAIVASCRCHLFFVYFFLSFCFFVMRAFARSASQIAAINFSTIINSFNTIRLFARARF